MCIRDRAPYAALAQAVRAGDLAGFKAVAETHAAAFAADKTHLLVARLRRNVIRVGLRRVSLAYSSISLADVAAKLGLATNAEDVERVVAKAIRDGGVDASLDHERQLLVGAAATDAYATREPQAAFHARIAFCLDAHNEAVRAMRYPPAETAKRGGHSAKHVLALEEELATHIMEDDEMDEF